VFRAMWRIVLFFELKHAVSVHGCGWAKEDIHLLREMKLEDIWIVSLRDTHTEEMMTVAEWVSRQMLQ